MTLISNSNPSSLIQIAEGLQKCRNLMLRQVSAIDPSACFQSAHPDFSPIGWHLGHIAYTEDLWVLQRLAGQSPSRSDYHRLFAQDGLPKQERIHLPPLSDILAYLETVRSRALAYLPVAPLEQQARLWHWLIQHESQHAETIALVWELLKRSPAQSLKIGSQLPAPSTFPPPASQVLRTMDEPRTEMIEIPAGAFQQGNDTIVAQDNERPIHTVHLASYWIDRYPVTRGQYRSFIQAGGYYNRQWWSKQGWYWQQTAKVSEPLYSTEDMAYDDHPVCGVSGYEAEAYARFVGKRLPTEAEWEKAASWQPDTQQSVRYPWGDDWPDQYRQALQDRDRCNCRGNDSSDDQCSDDKLPQDGHNQDGTTPVDRYPQGQSAVGCYDLLGNVWEWTTTLFHPYPDFSSYPYPGYSQTYFDGAHWVLKGGSWATFPWAMRNAFRNWYVPSTRQVLAGFRCVR